MSRFDYVVSEANMGHVLREEDNMFDEIFGDPLKDLDEALDNSYKDNDKHDFINGLDLTVEAMIEGCLEELFDDDYDTDSRKERDAI